MKKVIVLLLFSCVGLNAQSGIVAAGSDARVESNQSVTFTIGQVFYQSYRDGPQSHSVNEGLQQPYEILVEDLKTEDPEFKLIAREFDQTNYDINNLDLRISPNPFTNYISIETNDLRDGMQYYLHDNLGRTISVENLNSTMVTLDLSQHPSGLYFLTVTIENNPVKTIKLIKQQL